MFIFSSVDTFSMEMHTCKRYCGNLWLVVVFCKTLQAIGEFVLNHDYAMAKIKNVDFVLGHGYTTEILENKT